MMRHAGRSTRTATSALGGVLVTLALAGCTSAARDLHDNRDRCSGPGYRDGCMYIQPYPHDREHLSSQEKALINAQQARENLRMLREIRKRRGE